MASEKKGEKQQATGLRADRLTRKDLKGVYGVTRNQLSIDDDLFDLFQKAFDEQWTKERWDLEFKATDWYQKNARPMREYLLAAADPENADFIEKKKDTAEFVRRSAMNFGKNLSTDAIQNLAEQTLMFGWGEPGQEFELQRAIAALPSDGEYGGDVRGNADNLKALAAANGVQYDDSWFEGAGVSIASGLSRADFWQNQITDQAASMFPVFREQINAGLSMRQVASPYTKMMQDMWEIDANSISLDDPTLLGALTNYDAKGNPSAINLGEFRQRLRQDPRFMDTAKAQNEVADIASGVLKMFGIGG